MIRTGSLTGKEDKGSYTLGVYGPEGVYASETADTEMGTAAFDSLIIAAQK